VFSIPIILRIFFQYDRHLHAFVSDGLFRKSGVFYVMPKVDLGPLEEIFRAKVLKRLVIYHSKMTHGKNKKNFVVYEAEDFIVAICRHIPEKFFQMVRYFGFYSNKSRGMRRKQGILRPGDEPLPEAPADVDIIDVSEYNPPHVPSKTWRECIKKLWEVDPLVCPRCNGPMRVISFIKYDKIQ